jgi:hypothetical protein
MTVDLTRYTPKPSGATKFFEQTLWIAGTARGERAPDLTQIWLWCDNPIPYLIRRVESRQQGTQHLFRSQFALCSEQERDWRVGPLSTLAAVVLDHRDGAQSDSHWRSCDGC